MEEGEIIIDKAQSPAKPLDEPVKDCSPDIEREEKCVADEKAPEDSDKEDGELDEDAEIQEKEESETIEVKETDPAVMEQDSCQKTEPSEELTVTEQSQEEHHGVDTGGNPAEKEEAVMKESSNLVEQLKNNNLSTKAKVMDAEEGELEDSGDDAEIEKMQTRDSQINSAVKRSNETDSKEGAPTKMEFDESRPEEEQLDYGEDELEDNLKSEAPAQTVAATDDKSEGEADSESEGEIKSDTGDDFEEGETRDHPMDHPPEQKKVCKFFEMGNCTWGERCRYLHPGVNDKGNYDMFSDEPPKQPSRVHAFAPPERRHPDPFWPEPPPFAVAPVAETAWEKGLRHAKEMKKRAMQRKVQEPDFLQKREVISTINALNEDRDMEFVNTKPLTNKGYDPFDEKEGDEYATPTPEEVRRHLMRERRHHPPPHRHPIEKEHRLHPPDHMMHPDVRRERRPPSPRHERFPPDMRSISPRRDNDRERRGNFPPDDPGFPPHFDERRERRGFPDRPDIARGPYAPEAIRREPAIERMKDDRYPAVDGSHGSKGPQNGALPPGQSQTWSDPWARGRPQAKGRNKTKPDSSSSSGSSSDSSSRSSSRSSDSSRSSASRSSGSSSSGSSRSSSYSSDRDSSHSPSPSKKAGKKKVLASAKQRNGASAQLKKNAPPARLPPNMKPVAQIKPDPSALPTIPVKKPVPDKKPLTQNQNVPNDLAPHKLPQKKQASKKRTSSSSSEFSHSSDSSPSPSRVQGKSKSGSDSASGSSSDSSSSSMSSTSASSSSDSEGDKPANRRKRKPVKPAPVSSQMPPNMPGRSPLPQQSTQGKGKVMVPSKPGRKDVKMTIIDKPGGPKKRTASEMLAQGKKPSSRRTELLEQLKAVEDAIARKRAKMS